MNKHVFVGYVGGECEPYGVPVSRSVFVRVKFDGKKLSLVGVVGPLNNGDCRGGCGQINPLSEIPDFHPAFDKKTMKKIDEIWERWHLNDMQAGCEHQRKEGWDKKPIDPSKPLNSYGKHFEGQRVDSWNMLAWVSEKEHPQGLLDKACPVCGYKYGTQWLFEKVPQNVIDFLSSLPDDTGKVPPCWRK